MIAVQRLEVAAQYGGKLANYSTSLYRALWLLTKLIVLILSVLYLSRFQPCILVNIKSVAYTYM